LPAARADGDRPAPRTFKHYHLRAGPEKNRERVDVRAFGLGERIVFLPYTREVFTATQDWTRARNLVPEQPGSPVGHDQAALV
jgi:NitT/TauT family transport system substrate-binding protein